MIITVLIAATFGLLLQPAPLPAAAPVERVWYDGDRPMRVWMAPDEVAVVYEPAAAAPAAEATTMQSAGSSARLLHRSGPVAYFRITSPQRTRADHVAMMKREPGVRHAAPAYYGSRAMRAADAMALSGEIIVGFAAAADANAFAQAHGIRLLKRIEFMPDAYIFDARHAPDSLAMANDIRREAGVKFAYPNWYRSMARR